MKTTYWFLKTRHCLCHVYCLQFQEIICIVSHVKCFTMVTNNFNIHIYRRLTVRFREELVLLRPPKSILRRNLGTKYLLWCCCLTKSRAANIPQAESSGERELLRKRGRNNNSDSEKERAAWCWQSSSLCPVLTCISGSDVGHFQQLILFTDTRIMFDQVNWSCICRLQKAVYQWYVLWRGECRGKNVRLMVWECCCNETEQYMFSKIFQKL